MNQDGVEGITGAEVADGIDGCVKAVRRQIGAGADWIKALNRSDYRVRSRMAGVSSVAGKSIATFSDQELETIIKTAHSYGVKVAAHATNEDTIQILLDLGVDSIEHGVEIDIKKIRGNLKWAPTLAAFYTSGGENSDVWKHAKNAFQRAVEAGFDNIVCGGDTGVFAHGENALEMQLMVNLGADWKKVLRWGTLGGWECVRSTGWEGEAGAKRLSRVVELKEDWRVVGDNEVPFGAIRKGFAADIIATSGDFEHDFGGAVAASSIIFVMKAGRVHKQDGIKIV
ncbi:hypothetical protein HWV62_7386 [Athelia sp. TMB]|nr:hypothetical protein HWV62_22207 [Athelia sp. TMB]KAF7976203.1 hypothetical protein HWV62_7386 [Athelia sp. TMB]